MSSWEPGRWKAEGAAAARGGVVSAVAVVDAGAFLKSIGTNLPSAAFCCAEFVCNVGLVGEIPAARLPNAPAMSRLVELICNGILPVDSSPMDHRSH